MITFVEETNVGAFDHWIDIDGAIWAELGVFDQPSFAFINDDGTVDVNVGALGEDGLAERLQALIDG